MPNQSFNHGDVSALGAPGVRPYLLNPFLLPVSSPMRQQLTPFLQKYPRSEEQIASLSMYANKMHDYCNYHDGVCDTRGVGNLTAHVAHVAYTSDYNKIASEWLETMLAAEN